MARALARRSWRQRAGARERAHDTLQDTAECRQVDLSWTCPGLASKGGRSRAARRRAQQRGAHRQLPRPHLAQARLLPRPRRCVRRLWRRCGRRRRKRRERRRARPQMQRARLEAWPPPPPSARLVDGGPPPLALARCGPPAAERSLTAMNDWSMSHVAVDCTGAAGRVAVAFPPCDSAALLVHPPSS